MTTTKDAKDRRNVQYKEWSDLGISDFSELQAKKVVENFAEKFEQYVNNEIELIVHAKQYDTDGTKRKHSINARLTFPGETLAGSSTDWDFKTAVHSSLNALDVQLQKRFGK